MRNYRRELTEYRDVQVNQATTEDYVDRLYNQLFYVDDGQLGNLYTGGDVSAVIQAALDAAEAAGGGVVRMPNRGQTFLATNLRVGSRTDFDLNGCTIQVPIGSTGFIIGNKSVNSYGYTIRNGILDARGYSVHGVLLDHTGGVFPAGYAEPEARLFNLRVQTCGTAFAALVDSYRLVWARGTWLINCRSRQPKQDCFAFLTGTTDCLMVECESEVAGRYGLNAGGGYNTAIGLKIGEAFASGIAIPAGVIAWNISDALIDNTGYATFAAGQPVLIEGSENIVTDIIVNRGGAGVGVIVTGSRNRVNGIVRNQGGSTLTYAIQAPVGAVDNVIDLTVASSGTAAMTTGIIDPLTDTARNQISINGRRNEPPETSCWDDDFTGQSVESGEIGKLGWNSTGTTVTSLAAVAGHPGIIQVASSNVANNFGNLFLANAANGSVAIATDVAYYAFAVRIPTITNVDVRVGLSQDLGTAISSGTDAVLFIFADGSSAKWIVVTRSGGVQTATITTLANVAANTWYWLEAYRQPGGNWEFWVNGTLAATHSANLPTVGLNVGGIVTTTNAAIKTLDFDLHRLKSKNLVKRY